MALPDIDIEEIKKLNPLELQSLLAEVQDLIGKKTRIEWSTLVNAIPIESGQSTNAQINEIGLKWYCEHYGPITITDGELMITFDQTAFFGDVDEDNLFETEGSIVLLGKENDVILDEDEEEYVETTELENLEQIATTTPVTTRIPTDMSLEDLKILANELLAEQVRDSGNYWYKMTEHIKQYLNKYEQHNIIITDVDGQQITITLENADFGVNEEQEIETTNLITIFPLGENIIIEEDDIDAFPPENDYIEPEEDNDEEELPDEFPEDDTVIDTNDEFDDET